MRKTREEADLHNIALRNAMAMVADTLTKAKTKTKIPRKMSLELAAIGSHIDFD